MPAPQHVHRIFIRATQHQVWQAITDHEFTRRYYFGTAFESTLEPGSPFRYVMPDGEDAVVGSIEEVDPPNRLVMTWRALYDAATAEEPPSRVEWVLAASGEELTCVTAIHRDLGRSPATSASVAGGLGWILDNMKTLLETGRPLPAPTSPTSLDSDAVEHADDADAQTHRWQAVEAHSAAWELLGRDTLSDDESEDLLRRAYAAAYHWARAAGRGQQNEARAEYVIAKAQCKLGRADMAGHHARRCYEATTAAGLKDFDLAYAFEVMARAAALAGDDAAAGAHWEAALAVPIEDPEDRALVTADLADHP